MPAIKTNSTRAAFANRLVAVITQGLTQAGMKGIKISTEHVRGTKLHRVVVVTKQFQTLPYSERQDLLWRIVRQHFKPEEELRISTILALTPEDLKAA